MGGANSNVIQQNSLGNKWRVVERTNNMSNIVSNVQDGRLGEEYLVPFASNLKPNEELDIYNYRRTNNIGLVRTEGAEVQENSGGFCGGEKTAKIVTEYLPERLSTIPQFSFPEGLYVLRNVLMAFREIHRKYGPIDVTDDMVAFTPQGEVRSWLNPNFALNHPDNESLVPVNGRTDEADMVKNIFDMVEYHTENGHFPPAFVSRTNNQGYLDFMIGQSLVESYARDNNVPVLNHIDMARTDYGKKHGAVGSTSTTYTHGATSVQPPQQAQQAQQVTTTTTTITQQQQPQTLTFTPPPPPQVSPELTPTTLFQQQTFVPPPTMVRVPSASKIVTVTQQQINPPTLVRVPSASRIVTTTTQPLAVQQTFPAAPALVRVSSASRLGINHPTSFLTTTTNTVLPPPVTTATVTTMNHPTSTTFLQPSGFNQTNFTSGQVGAPQVKFSYGGASSSNSTISTGSYGNVGSYGTSYLPSSAGYAVTSGAPISTNLGTTGFDYGNSGLSSNYGAISSGQTYLSGSPIYTGATLGSNYGTTGTNFGNSGTTSYGGLSSNETIFGNAGYTSTSTAQKISEQTTTIGGLSSLNNYRAY